MISDSWAVISFTNNSAVNINHPSLRLNHVSPFFNIIEVYIILKLYCKPDKTCNHHHKTTQ